MHTLSVSHALFFLSGPYSHYICISMIQPRFGSLLSLARFISLNAILALEPLSPFLPQFTNSSLHFMRMSVRLIVVYVLLLLLSYNRFHQTIEMNSIHHFFLLMFCVCVCVKLWNTPTNLSANNVVIFINPVKLALLHIIFKRKKDTVQFTASVFCIVFIWKHCCGVWCVCVHVL